MAIQEEIIYKFRTESPPLTYAFIASTNEAMRIPIFFLYLCPRCIAELI